MLHLSENGNYCSPGHVLSVWGGLKHLYLIEACKGIHAKEHKTSGILITRDLGFWE